MKILFFSPYSFVWQSSYLELGLAEQLSRAGHQVDFMRCDGLLNSFCNSMSAFGLNPDSTSGEKEAVCLRCKRTRNFITNDMDFSTILAEDYLTASDVKKVEDILGGVTPDNWHKLELKNIPIGRYSSYEFLIRNKLRSRLIPPHLWLEFLNRLKQGLQVYFISQNFFGENKLDRLIVYNHAFALNHIFTAVAQSHGIICYTIQASGGLHAISSGSYLFRLDQSPFVLNRLEKWNEFSLKPLNEVQIRGVEKHLSALLDATSPWVYSSPIGAKPVEEIMEILGVEKGKKILLMSMSSEDELYSAEFVGLSTSRVESKVESIFANQLEWVKYVSELVSNRNDLHLIIRVHPREFPNKRESVLAPHVNAFIESIKGRLGVNVSLNTPGQGISIYDLIPMVDVLINATSSVGAEFAAYGVPVVNHDTHLLTAFPSALTMQPKNRSDIESTIDEAIRSGRNLDLSVLTYRWMYFRYFFINESFEPKDWRIIRFIIDGIRRPKNKYGMAIPVFILRFFMWSTAAFSKIFHGDMPPAVKTLVQEERGIPDVKPLSVNEGTVDFENERKLVEESIKRLQRRAAS